MKISYTSNNLKSSISKLKNTLLKIVFLDHLKKFHKLNYASLKLTAAIVLIGNTAFPQKAINGIIKDSLNIPITGASVVLKGKNVFAISDVNGKFNIEGRESLPFTLQVKFIGYKTKEILIEELPKAPLEIVLLNDNLLSEVIITSRRRKEPVQEVPIPISVLSGALVEESGAFNVNRVKELVPTVQLYSSNPRNTGLNIRGLGSSFGLTNDGLDPGVGFYVDGVYFARPAATTLDFIDIEQIEVLRGPQGTLFGKNTTAGAFNVTTRKPGFTTGASFEASYGNFGFIQSKLSLTGPLSKKFAARVSFSGTQRDGLIENIVTQKFVNDLNNLGIRGQLLYTPTNKISVTLAADATQQRPDGYAQVFAGVAPTKRPGYRQFDTIISSLNYALPSRNPFDRKIDHDTPWRSGNDLGGISLNVDIDLGPGTLTSTTAWRYWDWNPSNDRDFTGLPVLAKSQAPSKHQQWSQEIRYAGKFHKRLSGVFGVFAIGQELKTSPFHTEESGSAQWRFSQSTSSSLWQTPGLFEGYGIKTKSSLNSFSGAAFANLDWEVINRLHILPGIRYNYDQKKVDFDRKTYGGLQTSDPALIALKKLVYTDQAFSANVDNTNFSGQLTVAFKASKQLNTYATYSTSFKPIGINLGGLPNNAQGKPDLDLAVIKPEYVSHFEFGFKSSPFPGTTINATFHHTDIKDYQTLVQSPELGVNRGYLANAEKVNVIGAEFDISVRANRYISFYGAGAYTEGKYVSFTNAPLPLEETGLRVNGVQVAFKDISGSQLPGISKWAGSIGAELNAGQSKFLGQQGKFFLAVESYHRSSFSSSASPSAYLNVDGYGLLNTRFGFRASEGLSIIFWARNVLNQNYFEQLLPAGGNAGHYAGVLGDPRTFGATIKYSF